MASANSYDVNARSLALLGMVLLLQGCEGAHGDTAPVRIAKQAAPPAASPMLPPGHSPSPASPPGPYQLTRTIDQDPDGDGIANRRIIITERFDDSGALVERIREQDLQADGIVDARDVTRFGGAGPPGP